MNHLIHMKCQALFSLKNTKEIKMSSAAAVISILRVKHAAVIKRGNMVEYGV